MFKTLVNIFKVPELRNKILFTLFMLTIYRIGYHVPLPGVDQSAFEESQAPGTRAVRAAQQQYDVAKAAYANNPSDLQLQATVDKAKADLDSAQEEKKRKTGQQENGAAGRLASYVSLFSGGNLSQSTIFGLGVMPYISASIIFQLLGTVVPSLEKMQKEGETGRKKIQEWTRYATIPLALIQGIFWLHTMQSPQTGGSLIQPYFARYHDLMFWTTGLCAMTAGCIFLMWLGEQIDEYGLGNGVSLIILAGIVARMPNAIGQLISLSNFTGTEQPGKIMTPGKIIFLIASFIFVVAGSILITQAQRRIPIQQAKHTRGRRVYGGAKQYLPLRVNHGGVMPIIFAQSLMLFPTVAFSMVSTWLANAGIDNWFTSVVHFGEFEFHPGRFVHILTEVIMIYFFSYFWTTVQFQPKEMANQLRDYGSFIPGLRPGKRTADYLERVMMRITYVGAAFLCLIAIVPTVLSVWMNIPIQITAFLGGTGLLIVVSVALDMVQRIEANLLMRNYSGFLGSDGKKGKRIKGRQY